MCDGMKKVVKECVEGNKHVENDARRIGRYPEGAYITDPKEFAHRVFATIYQGTENSSQETRQRQR